MYGIKGFWGAWRRLLDKFARNMMRTQENSNDFCAKEMMISYWQLFELEGERAFFSLLILAQAYEV